MIICFLEYHIGVFTVRALAKKFHRKKRLFQAWLDIFLKKVRERETYIFHVFCQISWHLLHSHHLWSIVKPWNTHSTRFLKSGFVYNEYCFIQNNLFRRSNFWHIWKFCTAVPPMQFYSKHRWVEKTSQHLFANVAANWGHQLWNGKKIG